MASTGTCLIFNGTIEAAFTFYKSVFGTEFVGGIARMGEVPPQEGQTELNDDETQLVLSVQLPILGGHLLLGSDMLESMGMTLNQGNNSHICLQPDTRTESDRLFAALSEGGTVEMRLMEMFWGDYFGSWVDKFGIQWMLNCSSTS